MRYRITFRKKYKSDAGFCVNYKPLMHRGESFLSYVIAERLKEMGILRDNVFDFKTVEAKLLEVVKNVGGVYLAGAMYVHRPWEEDKVLNEEKYIRAIEEFDLYRYALGKKGDKTKITGKRDFNVYKMVELDGVGVDFSKWKRLIFQNLEGRGGVANKLWTYWVVDADRVSFVIESELSEDEIYKLFEGKEFSFFSKRRYLMGRFICEEVVRCEDDIVRFIPLERLEEVTREYEVRVINEVVIREGPNFVPWYGEEVNGVFCAIGCKKRESKGVELKISRFKDLDLRLGNVLIGADEIRVETKGLVRREGICGLCRHKGEVWEKVQGSFWENFTMQAYLSNTRYLCEKCLVLKALSSKRGQYRQFIQVNFEKYNWREGLGVELPWEGYFILSMGGEGNKASYYFAKVNYICGERVRFLVANKGEERFYTRLFRRE
ncbi:MAG: hypothetical protein QXX30_02600 [Candidatus Aenigmatarchaeota archaeon]